ncbi:YdcH family protein [Sphingobium sp. SJ10-10]|uniref:YdcH family protein n=1 Tax=Sphingobium sp. SJ10-10 TaxID=3114999 RepID=UPI002E18B1B2|nr:YdcH family protein [Sphingobium sp. SJ10-10]
MQVSDILPSSQLIRSIHFDWREALNTFLYKLTRLHGQLEEEIRSELKRRFPDSLRLLRLKKVRLHVKDRLHAHVLRERRA